MSNSKNCDRKDILLNNDAKAAEKLSAEDQKLIQEWRKKGGGKKSSITQKVIDREIFIDVRKSDGTANDKHDLIASTLSTASGSLDTHFALSLLHQYVNVQNIEGKIEKAVVAGDSFINSMISLQPKDEIEGMLLTQIFSLQTLGMNCGYRAADPENSIHNVDRNVNNLTKLLRLQHETIETLNRYRRKGTQQLVVQHVNVNDGGKAVVGGIMNGEGGQ